jgi:hypothetical protein
MSPWAINRKRVSLYLLVLLALYIAALFLLPAGTTEKENKTGKDSIPDSSLNL